MLIKTARRMVLDSKVTYLAAAVSVAISAYLVLFEWGVYEGYRRDTTVVLDAFDSDLWIIPRGQPSFDGYTSIDDSAYWKATNVRGITAARVVWAYTSWRLPVKQSLDTVQLLGIEFDTDISPNLRISETNDDMTHLLRQDGNILIGKKSKAQLEVDSLEVDGIEINGRRAQVVGFVDDIHLFSTFGFVMTDFENAKAFLRLPSSHTTYVTCKCAPGIDLAATARQLQHLLPDHEVVTSEQFRRRTYHFWQTKTGVGPILLLPAIIAQIVGFLVVTLTFYVSTFRRLPLFACLKAMGAANGELVVVLSSQVAFVTVVGYIVACVGLLITVTALRSTTVSIVITPFMVGASALLIALFAAIGASLSIRKIVSTDPGLAFR